MPEQNESDPRFPQRAFESPEPDKPRWLRHAVGWLLVSAICQIYLTTGMGVAATLAGTVIAAYWERGSTQSFIRVITLGGKHGGLIGLGGVAYLLIGSIGMSLSGVRINAPLIAIAVTATGLYISLYLGLFILVFYLLIWLAQWSMTFSQPMKSLPAVCAGLALIVAMTNAREATLSSPDKTRTDNQEICRRGEAPPPDQQRPLLSTCMVHPGEITAVRFTRDGRSLVSLGGGYKIWNLSDRTLLATIPTERVANSPRHIMLSADEQLLLTGTEAQNHSVTVWKLFDGEALGGYHTAPGDTVTPLGFGGGDGQTVLAFSRQQGLIGWDLSSHQIVLSHPLADIDWCIAYPSPKLRFIAIVCGKTNGTPAQSQFYAWDSQAKSVMTPKLRTLEIYGIEFSDDERTMGVGTGGRPTDFDFYDTTSWTATNPAAEAAQLLRMRIELARGYGELFWLPDPKPGRKGYRINAYKVAMSHDGSLKAVYVEGPYNLRLVDMRTDQGTDLCPTGCYGGSPILHALAMSPDQRWLAAVYGGGISLWDLPAKQLVTSLHIPPRGEGNAPTAPHIQPVTTATLASQCAGDLADACYQHGLNERRAGHRAEAEAILQKACGLRGSYCLELAKVAKSEGDPANELRWMEAACQQRERQGCQQWMYAAESKRDDSGVQSALLGICKIDAGYCPSLLVKADKAGTTPQVIDLVCGTTADGCESLGKSLESVQRLVHAQRAYHLACQQGKAHSCGRETELNPRVKPARATS